MSNLLRRRTSMRKWRRKGRGEDCLLMEGENVCAVDWCSISLVITAHLPCYFFSVPSFHSSSLTRVTATYDSNDMDWPFSKNTRNVVRGFRTPDRKCTLRGSLWGISVRWSDHFLIDLISDLHFKGHGPRTDTPERLHNRRSARMKPAMRI